MKHFEIFHLKKKKKKDGLTFKTKMIYMCVGVCFISASR